MDLTAAALSVPVAVAAIPLFAAIVLVALAAGRRDSAWRGHRFPAALVCILVLWQMRAVTADGPALHLLGAVLLQLMFGWRLAIVGLAAVIAGHTANGAGSWLAFGWNGLLLAALPVAVGHAVTGAVARHAPGNPFAYILIAGFAAGALAMLAVLLATTALLLLAGTGDATRVLEHYAVSGILVVFPEAFVTGAVLAWLAMFYPQAVATWRPPWEGGASR